MLRGIKLNISRIINPRLDGVSHSTVARAANGETVDADTLIRIAEFLNVPVESILNIQESPDEVLEKIGIIVNMEPELKDTLVEISEMINNKKINKKILTELAAFAAFWLHIHAKNHMA